MKSDFATFRTCVDGLGTKFKLQRDSKQDIAKTENFRSLENEYRL